eukprot:15452156-Alexandrium_andersonii.AAC.1
MKRVHQAPTPSAAGEADTLMRRTCQCQDVCPRHGHRCGQLARQEGDERTSKGNASARRERATHHAHR